MRARLSFGGGRITNSAPSRLRLPAAVFLAVLLAAAYTLWDALRFHPSDAAALAEALGPLTAEPPAVQALLTHAADAVPLAKPRRGDWLAEHREPGQTFADYAGIYPRTPRPGVRPLALTWVGPTPENWQAEAAAVERFLKILFQAPLTVLPPRPSAGFPARTNANRRQLLATAILKDLEPSLPPDAACLLALTAEDLYPVESWNYVFGLASIDGRVGVHSVARLYSPDERQRLRRVLTVAGHEAAHAFGLRHCIHRRCLMNGFNSLDELDRGTLALCPICLRKLAWGSGVDLVRLHRDLAEFLAQEGLKEDAAVFRTRLGPLPPQK